MTSELPNYLSPAVLQAKSGLSRSTIDRLCKQGRLEKRRLSDGRVGITQESWDKHLAGLNGVPEPPSSERRISRRHRELKAQSAARRAERKGNAR